MGKLLLPQKPRAPLPPARADGRPLYYFVGPGVVINDPANSPHGDEGVYQMAWHELPDNAVIYNRATDQTTDKNGEGVT